MGILRDRRGQVWEWLSRPVERYYITKSWAAEYPPDGMPITVHEMINLNTGELVDRYYERHKFEELAVGDNPEMTRLL